MKNHAAAVLITPRPRSEKLALRRITLTACNRRVKEGGKFRKNIPQRLDDASHLVQIFFVALRPCVTRGYSGCSRISNRKVRVAFIINRAVSRVGHADFVIRAGQEVRRDGQRRIAEIRDFGVQDNLSQISLAKFNASH